MDTGPGGQASGSQPKPKKERKKHTEGGDQKKEPRRRSPAGSKSKKNQGKLEASSSGPVYGSHKETPMAAQGYINLAQHVPTMAERKYDPTGIQHLSTVAPPRIQQPVSMATQQVVPVRLTAASQLPPATTAAPQRVTAQLPPKKSLSPSRIAALSEHVSQRSGEEKTKLPAAVTQAQVMAMLHQHQQQQQQQSEQYGHEFQKQQQQIESEKKLLQEQQLLQLKSHQKLQQTKEYPHTEQQKGPQQQTQQQPNWNVIQVRQPRPPRPFVPGQQPVVELTSGARQALPGRLITGHPPVAPTGLDAGGLLRQQLLQKLVTTQTSEAQSHSNIFSAYKHAPDFSVSETTSNAPPPNVSLASRPEIAEIERRIAEAKQRGGVEMRSIADYRTTEPQPQPAHIGDRLSPAPRQVSTIRRTPSPAHVKIERMSPVPQLPSPGKRHSPAQARDRSQPVNLSVQEGHHGLERLPQPTSGLQQSFGQPYVVTTQAASQRMRSPPREDYTQGRDMMSFAQAQGEILRQTLTGVMPNQPPGTRVFDASGVVTRIPERNVSPRHVDVDSSRKSRQSPSPNRHGHIDRGGPSPHRHISPVNISDQKSHNITQPVISVASVQYTSPQRLSTPPRLSSPMSTEIRHRAPSPKPQHRHKESMAGGIPRAQTSINNVSLNLPPNTGPIRQPVVNLVRLPVPVTDSRQFPTMSVNAVSQAIAQVSAPPIQSQVSGEYVPQISPAGQEQTTQAAPTPQRVPLSQLQQKTSPFTFPPQAPTTLSQMDSHAFTRYNLKVPNSQAAPELQLQAAAAKQEPTSQANIRTTQIKKKIESPDEMPKLTPIGPLQTDNQENQDVEMVTMMVPFNKRLQNIANMPTSTIYRSTYRAHSVAIHRAKAGVITSTAKSLDILRQNLQKSINKEIDLIVQQYLEKYFKPGIENIRFNNGEGSISDEHVQAVCRQILEEAKKMYSSDQSLTPSRDIPDNVSESGSTGSRRVISRKRRPSDTDSDKSQSVAPRKVKKKGRPPLYTSSGRTTPSKTVKANEPVKREGPKWDSERLKSDSKFVMGARANKALGLGATRGRIYIKHPEVFKYSGDQDDKQWLYENQHMPATGGKAYMLLLEDVRELGQEEEYKDNPNVVIGDLRGFCIPEWMLDKAKAQMTALRTDTFKPKQNRSRSTTPVELPNTSQQDDVDGSKLPFSSFASPKGPDLDKGEVSPAETEMEFLSADNEMNENVSSMSPFNITGGFDEGTSPSDLDTLDEDSSHLSNAPFDLNK